MSNWRVIFTDSESLTGVAPECTDLGDHPVVRHIAGEPEVDESHMYDCCPRPHIETWSEAAAKELAQRLTDLGAEVA